MSRNACCCYIRWASLQEQGVTTARLLRFLIVLLKDRLPAYTASPNSRTEMLLRVLIEECQGCYREYTAGDVDQFGEMWLSLRELPASDWPKAIRITDYDQGRSLAGYRALVSKVYKRLVGSVRNDLAAWAKARDVENLI